MGKGGGHRCVPISKEKKKTEAGRIKIKKRKESRKGGDKNI
jgi:hypothetical protein